MRVLRLTAWVTVVWGVVSWQAASYADVYNRHEENVLGTSLEISVVADAEQSADRAFSGVLEEISRLNGLLSTYDRESEVSHLNRSASLYASPELIEVIEACEIFRVRTMDAFSCRVGGLINLWRQAAEEDSKPERPEMRVLAGQIRRADLLIENNGLRVLRPESVVLNVDALAKGYIIDRALQAARASAPHAEGVLINIGGDIRTWGKGPHQGSWRIATGLRQEVTLTVSSGAVATSGRSGRDLLIGDENYSHILSPRDGWPVSDVSGATVYAPDALTADALATAFMVMPVGEGLDFAETQEGVEVFIRAEDGNSFKSSGWDALRPNENELLSHWPAGFTFHVDLEIPELEVANYERPYVAAWLADSERNLIRVLMLEGKEKRWMEENYYWHRRFGRRAGSLVDAVSEPTRRPGEYTLFWDGLDHEGDPVPPGEYILHIEASREHGGHQHERISVKTGDGPFSTQLSAGEELGRIWVSFGR